MKKKYKYLFLFIFAIMHTSILFFFADKWKDNSKYEISKSDKFNHFIHRNYSHIFARKYSSADHNKSTLKSQFHTMLSENKNSDEPQVILCFPFNNELDLLHSKLLILSKYVSLFVLSESISNDRGHVKKKLWFNDSKNETRFNNYNSQILHIIDKTIPIKKDWDLGWDMQHKIRSVIGEVIVSQLEQKYPNSIVIFGDSDEIPNVEAIKWLKTNCCKSKVTYEFASTMPAYIFGLKWQTKYSGYAMATARSMKDEARFWRNSFLPAKISFDQIVLPLPMYPSGFHCSYCFSTKLCVEKLKDTNLADGPPYLGVLDWTEDMFARMRSCGLTPQGDNAKNRPLFVKEIAENYPYLHNMPACQKTKIYTQ